MKDMTKASNPFYLAFFLLVVCGVSTLVMAFVAGKTKAPIEEALAAETKDSLKMILPEFDNDPARESCVIDGVTFMAARRGGVLVGIAAEAETGSGYGGKIRELVGFAPDGRIIAVLVTDENETPGLGKVVCERKFKKTIFNFFRPTPKGLPPNEILDQFTGRKADGRGNWRVKKDGGDFEYRTGATVTSRAVTELTGRAARVFSAHRAAIAAKFAGAKPEVKR